MCSRYVFLAFFYSTPALVLFERTCLEVNGTRKNLRWLGCPLGSWWFRCSQRLIAKCSDVNPVFNTASWRENFENDGEADPNNPTFWLNGEGGYVQRKGWTVMTSCEKKGPATSLVINGNHLHQQVKRRQWDERYIPGSPLTTWMVDSMEVQCTFIGYTPEV